MTHLLLGSGLPEVRVGEGGFAGGWGRSMLSQPNLGHTHFAGEETEDSRSWGSFKDLVSIGGCFLSGVCSVFGILVSRRTASFHQTSHGVGAACLWVAPCTL